MNTTDLLMQSLLAEASYADLRGVTTQAQLEDALVASGFSATQAAEFIQHWRVVPNGHQPDTSTGFSATVFQSLDDPNKYELAIRGTNNFFLDILSADIFGIALQGSAYQQIVDMYRYFRKLNTPLGESVNYSTDEIELLQELGGALTIDLIDLSFDEGLGVFDGDEVVDVTGHSLGGHLATWFAALFGNRANEVFTFNGAGIGGFGVEFIDKVTQLFGSGGLFDLGNAQITNTYGEGGWEIVSGVGAFVGSAQSVFIESNLDPFNNHSISTLTDSLAVYDLFSRLDPALTVDKITTILESSSNSNSSTLESIVNALGALFSVGTNVTVNNRDALYTRIQAINADLENNPFDLTVTSLAVMEGNDQVPVDTATLVANAQSNIAWRYALQELDPFVVEGSSSIETDQFYVPHNNNFELDIDNFSDDYLADRANFLALKLELGLTDSAAKFNATENIDYMDTGSGLTLETRRPAGAGLLGSQRIVFTSSTPGETAVAEGGIRDDRLYGFLGDEVLVGGTGEDTLEGGQGNDTLYSNNVARDEDGVIDTLKGGSGEDIYYVGDADEIEDSDRQVRFIEHRGVIVNGTYVEQADGSYRNDSKGIDLIINDTDATFILTQHEQVTGFRILERKGDRFIFDRNMTRRQDNAKEGTDPTGEYAASYCAAWT